MSLPQQSVWPLKLVSLNVAVRDEVKCIRDFPDHLSSEEGALVRQDLGG